ncbi:MAG TPA: peptidoglycan bridge formation glycyltransferase FemA/FemB family protein [Candidatus Dormibacteraeota bacterium]
MQRAEGWAPERVDLGAAGAASVQLTGLGPVRWAYLPRGPVPATAGALRVLAAWARRQGLARLRVEPEAPHEFGSVLRAEGFRPAPALHPTHTLILELGAEEKLLAGMKPKHRYNIRLAAKRGVTVDDGGDAAELARQHAATAERQAISAAGADFYERRLRDLEWSRVYVARHEGEALAAILVARFDGRAYYLFGGSTQAKRNLMPTYAVQWAAIRAAAADGCASYDFWGVPPDAGPDHPWAGLWQFKTGFGGRLVEYAGAWDLVLDARVERVLAANELLRRGVKRMRGLRNIR